MAGVGIIIIIVVGLILLAIMPDEADEAGWQQFNEDMAYRSGEEWPEKTESDL